MVEFDGQKYYTLREIADILHMHINSIRLYVKNGKLRATKVGRSYLVPEQDIKAMIEQGSKK